jgi:hypothetical protein
MPNIAPVSVRDEPPALIERKKTSGRGRKPSYAHLDEEFNTTLETSMEEQPPTRVRSPLPIPFSLDITIERWTRREESCCSCDNTNKN